MLQQIKDYEGYYEIDTEGNIYSLPRNGTSKHKKIIAQHKNRNGYNQCVLMKNNKAKTFLVHRLVAIAFIENPNNYPQINHKNGIKTDNNVENLEWCSISKNTKHAFDNNLNGFRDMAMKNIEIMNKDKYNLIILKNDCETIEFNSTNDASIYLKTNKDNITRAFRKKQKCKGYTVICKRTANGET